MGNHEVVWSACLKVIKDNISLQAYKTWFDPIIPVKLENEVLTIQVPSHFFLRVVGGELHCFTKESDKKRVGR